MQSPYRLIYIGILTAVSAAGTTYVRQSDITEDTHWKRSGSPYIVYGDLTIRNGATLTIDAGVEVRFAKVTGDGGYENGAELVLRDGTLAANGDTGLPVVFTAHSSNPKPGFWGGIIIEDGNQFILNHSCIRYAVNGLHLWDLSLSSSMESSTDYLEITNSEKSGIVISSGYADIYHTTVKENGWAGIKIDYGSCNVNIHYSDILNNGVWNLYNGSFDDVNATECWWGTTVESLIELRIYDKYDDPSKGRVDYKPYLSGSFNDYGNLLEYSWGTLKGLFFPDRGGDE